MENESIFQGEQQRQGVKGSEAGLQGVDDVTNINKAQTRFQIPRPQLFSF